MTKTIYLLDINHYAPEITALTRPFLLHYAKRIGADVCVIDKPVFGWGVTYEKLQIYKLARERGSDWNLFIDSDALIHPDCPDFTLYLPMGVVAFHSSDVSHIRFRPDEYAYRDGRFIAPGNWFTIGSRLCLDLWRPLEMSAEEAVSRITPTAEETHFGITAEHLVDDFALAHNIARFGLRFKSFEEIYKEHNLGAARIYREADKEFRSDFLFHQYTVSQSEKVIAIKKRITEWRVSNYLEAR